jgi:hypothetical protein
MGQCPWIFISPFLRPGRRHSARSKGDKMYILNPKSKEIIGVIACPPEPPPKLLWRDFVIGVTTALLAAIFLFG